MKSSNFKLNGNSIYVTTLLTFLLLPLFVAAVIVAPATATKVTKVAAGYDTDLLYLDSRSRVYPAAAPNFITFTADKFFTSGNKLVSYKKQLNTKLINDYFGLSEDAASANLGTKRQLLLKSAASNNAGNHNLIQKMNNRLTTNNRQQQQQTMITTVSTRSNSNPLFAGGSGGAISNNHYQVITICNTLPSILKCQNKQHFLILHRVIYGISNDPRESNQCLPQVDCLQVDETDEFNCTGQNLCVFYPSERYLFNCKQHKRSNLTQIHITCVSLNHLRKYFAQKNRKFDPKLFESRLQAAAAVTKHPAAPNFITGSKSQQQQILFNAFPSTMTSNPSSSGSVDEQQLENFLANTFIGLKKNNAFGKFRFNLSNLNAGANGGNFSTNKLQNSFIENRLSTLIVDDPHLKGNSSILITITVFCSVMAVILISLIYYRMKVKQVIAASTLASDTTLNGIHQTTNPHYGAPHPTKSHSHPIAQVVDLQSSSSSFATAAAAGMMMSMPPPPPGFDNPLPSSVSVENNKKLNGRNYNSNLNQKLKSIQNQVKRMNSGYAMGSKQADEQLDDESSFEIKLKNNLNKFMLNLNEKYQNLKTSLESMMNETPTTTTQRLTKKNSTNNNNNYNIKQKNGKITQKVQPMAFADTKTAPPNDLSVTNPIFQQQSQKNYALPKKFNIKTTATPCTKAAPQEKKQDDLTQQQALAVSDRSSSDIYRDPGTLVNAGGGKEAEMTTTTTKKDYENEEANEYYESHQYHDRNRSADYLDDDDLEEDDDEDDDDDNEDENDDGDYQQTNDMKKEAASRSQQSSVKSSATKNTESSNHYSISSNKLSNIKTIKQFKLKPVSNDSSSSSISKTPTMTTASNNSMSSNYYVSVTPGSGPVKHTKMPAPANNKNSNKNNNNGNRMLAFKRTKIKNLMNSSSASSLKSPNQNNNNAVASDAKRRQRKSSNDEYDSDKVLKEIQQQQVNVKKIRAIYQQGGIKTNNNTNNNVTVCLSMVASTTASQSFAPPSEPLSSNPTQSHQQQQNHLLSSSSTTSSSSTSSSRSTTSSSSSSSSGSSVPSSSSASNTDSHSYYPRPSNLNFSHMLYDIPEEENDHDNDGGYGDDEKEETENDASNYVAVLKF